MSFSESYADEILNTALRIKSGDVLSINTEEEDYAFARLVAEKAKKITGNGSYIQLLRNGRVADEFDILSDFPLTKKPTLFLYLSYYKKKDEVESGRIYEAKDLQRFSLLSDPLDNPSPSYPFVTTFLPSSLWDDEIRNNYEEKTSRELLSSLFLPDRDERIRRHENMIYKAGELNRMALTDGRITAGNGTDLTFTFLPSATFHTSTCETTSGRLFSPYITAEDAFRLIDPFSLSGWLNTTRPFVLWGKRVNSLSLEFEKGRVVSVKGNMYTESLFSIYMRQDENAARAGMLTLVEKSSPLWNEELTYIPELDRMRTVSITLGGPKSEAVDTGALDTTIDSLLSLSLPIGDDSLTIDCLDRNGDERCIYSDGCINEDSDL